VTRLLTEREPIYGKADLTIASRDVPHDRIVDETIETLRGHLCGQAAASEPPADVASAVR
jgi:shikimate kinase